MVVDPVVPLLLSDFRLQAEKATTIYNKWLLGIS
jgi:hypothetical protein